MNAGPLMPSESHRKNVINAVGLSIVSFVLLCGLASAVFGIWKLEQAMAWPVVTGTIVESGVSRNCGGAGRAHSPSLRYRYRAGGVEHSGERLVSGSEICGAQSHAQGIADRYPIGTPVRVSVDPQAPNRAVLVIGPTSLGTWVLIAFWSLVFLLTATAACVYIVRARSGPGSQPSP